MRLILVNFLVILVLAASAAADAVRLRPRASAADAKVRLADVADLDGRIALDLADTVVATFGARSNRLTVTSASIRQILAKTGAHMGLLSVRGHMRCVVRRLENTGGDAQTAHGSAVLPAGAANEDLSGNPSTGPIGTATLSAVAAPVISNAARPIHVGTDVTLGDRLTSWLGRRGSIAADELNVVFPRRDAAMLAREALRDSYEFEALSRAKIGRIPIVVIQRRGGEVTASHRMTVQVARRVEALVATATIGRHQTLRPEKLALRSVLLDRDVEPLTRVEDAVGKMAATVLRRGMLITSEHLQARRLIRRGDMIDVHCVVGGMVIKTVARAMSDGSEGETIRVRNEHAKSRRTYMVRVVGAYQAVMDLQGEKVTGPVPSEEGAPARPAGAA